MKDPIVDEVRKYRSEIMESHGSLQSYHEAVMEQQAQYGKRLVKDTSKSDPPTPQKTVAPQN